MNTKPTYLIFTRQYHEAIEPFLLLLKSRKNTVSLDIWLTMVNYQKQNIIYNPQRYLRRELFLRKEMTETVVNIFDDFLKRELLFRPQRIQTAVSI